MVDHLGASQEMKAFFDKSVGRMESKLQGLVNDIKGLADKTATHSLENMKMSTYDSLLPQNRRFLDPMWNHLIANEFQNKPLSIFKSKYIGLMALSMAGMGHVGVLPALGVGLQLSSPRNISKGLMAVQRIKSKKLNVSPNAGKIVLRSLLNSASQSRSK